MMKLLLTTVAALSMIGPAMAQNSIRISSDWGEVTADLVNDDDATRALVKLLPLRIAMRDHLRQEKTGNLPSALPEVARQRDFLQALSACGAPIISLSIIAVAVSRRPASSCLGTSLATCRCSTGRRCHHPYRKRRLTCCAALASPHEPRCREHPNSLERRLTGGHHADLSRGTDTLALRSIRMVHGPCAHRHAFQSRRPPDRVQGAQVTFEPGARTVWHTHPLGQTLIVTSGFGRVQRQGGAVEDIRPGDVVWFEPGEKHWHGAAPQTAMTHIALQEVQDGKVVEWMEPVSEADYGR